ncbi:hypothetical protein CK203_056884 [Vitis vinifera]|uniref:Uncharacterized protein n=1 Tax=Vitis vinifera TaxID=29760 RepID=A0A438GW44_VITVI|nr:hypothetical protein CK203_056884 [Vitis vinifera]
MSQPRRDKEQEGKQKITSPKRFKGPTVKLEIAIKRSEGVKIDIQYNDEGEGVGEGYVQLVSYLGVLARTMVPIYHTDWRVVPVELKEKLWDCVKDSYALALMQIGNLRIGSSSWGCNYGDACFPNRALKWYIVCKKWTSESAPKVQNKTAAAVIFASSLCFPLCFFLLLSLHTLNDFGKGLWSSKSWFFMNLSFQKLCHNLSK